MNKDLFPHLPAVAGRRVNSSLADLEYRARVHLEEEQGKPLPENSLIALLCDTVRLCREQADMMGRPPIERPVEELLDRLITEAGKKDIALYDIHYCRAGWGILWHEDSSKRTFRQDGLLKVYTYYPTVRQMIEGEIRKLKGEKADG